MWYMISTHGIDSYALMPFSSPLFLLCRRGWVHKGNQACGDFSASAVSLDFSAAAPLLSASWMSNKCPPVRYMCNQLNPGDSIDVASRSRSCSRFDPAAVSSTQSVPICLIFSSCTRGRGSMPATRPNMSAYCLVRLMKRGL